MANIAIKIEIAKYYTKISHYLTFIKYKTCK